MATSKIILYENITRLGVIGDVVKVKAGFARNYLLPQGKAVRNTKANREYFETKKQFILADNLKKQQDARTIFQVIDNSELIMIMNTSETGQLYGSVGAREIIAKIAEKGAKIKRNDVVIERPFKFVGIYKTSIHLHSDIIASVMVNIARSEQEAITQRESGVIGGTADFFATKSEQKREKPVSSKDSDGNPKADDSKTDDSKTDDSKTDDNVKRPKNSTDKQGIKAASSASKDSDTKADSSDKNDKSDAKDKAEDENKDKRRD